MATNSLLLVFFQTILDTLFRHYLYGRNIALHSSSSLSGSHQINLLLFCIGLSWRPLLTSADWMKIPADWLELLLTG